MGNLRDARTETDVSGDFQACAWVAGDAVRGANKEGIRYQDIMNPPIWPSENRRLNVIWDGDGVTFSWLDDPDNPDNP